MTITNKKITKELDAQELADGPSDKLTILRWYQGCCKTSGQWYAFVNVRWDKYGTYSYESHRRWEPSAELMQLSKGII